MRGRRPIPTALKLIRGNPGKRPLPKGEPQLPLAAEGPPPAELAGNVVALAEWARLEPMLRRTRVLTEGDRNALTAACREWSKYLAASAKVDAAGLVVKVGKSDHPMPNPYLPIANRALALCLQLWSELGLTPASRARVTIAKETAADQLDTFLQ
jgi:P27 family predicted phage terminase small subunit